MADKHQNRLRNLRIRRGLTVEQVSDASGVCDHTLRLIENRGGNVTLKTALRLARFYGLPAEKIWQPLYDEVSRGVSPAPDRDELTCRM